MQRLHRRWIIAGLALYLGGCQMQNEDPPVTTSEDEIIGGAQTTARPEIGRFGGCTATLISPTYFITAAHCINYQARATGGTFTVTLNPTPPPPASPTVSFSVDAVYAFNGDPNSAPANNGLGRYDIAIGRLFSPVPAATATPTIIADGEPVDGETVTAFGYGCDQKLPTQTGGGVKRFRTITWPPVDVICPGDSGGPIVFGSLGGGGQILAINSGFFPNNTGLNDIVARPGSLKPRVEALIRSIEGGVEPGLDRAGGDLAVFTTTNATQCREQCTQRADCRAFSFVSGSNNCFIKAAAMGVSPNTSVSSGITLSRSLFDLTGADLAGMPLPGHNADTCEATCANRTDCVAFTFVTSDGNCWLKGAVPAPSACSVCLSGIKKSLELNVDRPGGDLPGMPLTGFTSAANCQLACVQRSDCQAFTHVASAQQCWLKNFVAPPVTGIAGMTSGVRHGIEVNVDRPGSDISFVDLADPVPEECQRRCLANAACQAWTMVTKPSAGAADGDVNRCFLKSAIPAANTAFGMFSGRRSMFRF